jgi:hypothetical protein
MNKKEGIPLKKVQAQGLFLVRPTPLPAPPPPRFINSKFSVSIYCCDCGTGAGISTVDVPTKPKDVAKAHDWEHAGAGRWRCAECAAEVDV